MLWPLLLMGLGFTFYYLSLLLIRMKSELVAARIRALHRIAMERPADDPGAKERRPPGGGLDSGCAVS
jgi:hypothetical protein